MSKLCIKAISQVDCNFLIAERKPENDSTGFKPVPARFFRALLKSKLLQRSFRCKYLKSQWDFRVKILVGRLPEAREIMNDQVLLGFSSLLHAYDFSPNCTPLSSITIMYLFYRMAREFQTNCKAGKKTANDHGLLSSLP